MTKIWLSFSEAKEFVKSLGLKNSKQWKIYCKLNNPNIPSDPNRAYKNQWIDWYDWLGKEKPKSLSETHPDLAKQLDPSKNNNITADNITAGSNQVIIWTDYKGHSWSAKINDRTKKNNPTGCPFCANKKVCLDNCLITTHPELCKEWHPIKNDELTPYDFTYGSQKKVWWYRESCGHEWDTSILSRTRGEGCPFVLD